ncbi:hypothetical protein BJY24_006365 [Nocardia transvalensis]|uniref:Uncharacterized protein n=1 Tax=Nocardia transvalensis TaxID=37333 RepID=A0A7W9PL12_9NOCA|nr:hypothetical protein [Nocardia transvalensis]MBB5917453.1 hypothetical protein [Nocardia transvalensis]
MRTAFRDPGIPDGEKSVYSVGVTDRPERFEMTSVVGHAADGYHSLVEARLGPGDLTMTIEQTFRRAGGWLQAADYRAETCSGEEVVSREEAHFIDTTHLRLDGVTPFPANVMPLAAGLTLLRGLDFAEGAAESVDVWLAFSMCWPVTIRVGKPTTVEVPAGRVDTWQVRIRPGFAHLNTLLDKVLGGLVSPSVAHFEVAPPHRLVRFGFPTEPMSSSLRGLVELIA